MGKNFKLTAKTLFGFEDLLATELKNLGALNIQKGQRMVSFEGDDGFMYKANLACRTAIKILKPIYHFKANDEKSLYDGIMKYDWVDLFDVDKTFAIDATVFSDDFSHSKYVALLSKDAIVDQFRNAFNRRPNVDTEDPDVRINIHIHMNDVTVSLDSSGNSLHQRGYRTQTNEAPINEVLAAGLLMLSGWTGQCDFLDPMCGSGTILIEAGMIACNIPANIHRKGFAFEKWQDFDATLYEKIKENLLKKTKEFEFSILGFDIDFQTMKKAKININQAYLEDYIDVEKQDFFTSSKDSDKPLHIFFNPPYNERISINTEDFYKEIGNTLKRNYAGTNAWLITSNYDALKSVGLRPSAKIKTFNGALEARLVHYELYDGTKRYGKQLDEKK
jgi:putative N6-adenine-specific DNA methylase